MCENLRKIAACALILQKWHPESADVFLGIMSVFRSFRASWGKLGQKWEFFSGKLGKFGQKSFAPSKIRLLLRLWLRVCNSARGGWSVLEHCCSALDVVRNYGTEIICSTRKFAVPFPCLETIR